MTDAAPAGVPPADGLATLHRDISRQTARLWGGVADALAAAREEPWEWVPARVGETGPRLREMAERSCALEIAVALRLSESVVRGHAHDAASARARLPRLWAAFAAGKVGQQHVRMLLDVTRQLDDDRARAVDAQLAALATTMPAGRLRPRARRLAERVNALSLTERHREAAAGRRVWIEDVDDGMAWLHALLPAAAAHRAAARLDATAAALAAVEGETRNRDQLRADVTADLLTGDGTPHAVRATVGVTVPVMTLLGLDEQPATLDGRIPIDADTARRLTADAPSVFRILTDPIDSTVLDIGRRSYRPPADLARFVIVRDQLCTGPGCSRRARACDLDHTRPRSRDGSTSAANLAALCPSHHHLKHETLWHVQGEHGRMHWTSPHGITSDTDPPPI